MRRRSAAGRYIVSGCQRYDLRVMHPQETIRHDDEAASRLASKRGHDRFDFGVAVNGRYDRHHFERSGRRLE